MELRRHAWQIRLLLLAITGSMLTRQSPELMAYICTCSTLAGLWIGLWPYWKPQEGPRWSSDSSAVD